MAAKIWWQKPIVRQAWDFARVASLLMLVPLSVVVGIQLWKQAEQRRTLAQSYFSTARFTPDGKTLIGYGYSGVLPHAQGWAAAWSVKHGGRLWRHPARPYVRHAVLSPRGDRVLTRIQPGAETWEWRAEVREAASGRVLWNLPLDLPLYSTWVGDGRWIAAHDERYFTLYDGLTGRTLRKLTLNPAAGDLTHLWDLPGRSRFAAAFGQKDKEYPASDSVQVRSLPDGRIVPGAYAPMRLTGRTLPGGRMVQHDLMRDRLVLRDIKTGRIDAEINTAGFNSTLCGIWQVDAGCIELLFATFRYVRQYGSRPDEPPTAICEVRRERWNPRTGTLRSIWVIRDRGLCTVSSAGGVFAIMPDNGDTASSRPITVFDATTGSKIHDIKTQAEDR